MTLHNDKWHPVHTNNQTPTKECSVQHNSHPHNTDKNIKSSTLVHYWVLRQQPHKMIWASFKKLSSLLAGVTTLDNLFEVCQPGVNFCAARSLAATWINLHSTDIFDKPAVKAMF